MLTHNAEARLSAFLKKWREKPSGGGESMSPSAPHSRAAKIPFPMPSR